MSYFIYENLRKYFSDYSNSSQIDIFKPTSNYEVDIYNENNNTLVTSVFLLYVTVIFFLYVIASIFYMNKMKLCFDKKLSIYHEKLDKIQNEKTNMKKKYQNLILSIKRIKEIISLSDDRSAKKVCLISSEIQSKFNRI